MKTEAENLMGSTGTEANTYFSISPSSGWASESAFHGLNKLVTSVGIPQ